MLTNKITLEVQKAERAYQLLLEPNAPLGEIHDVLLEMREFVAQKIKEILDSQKPPQEAPVIDAPVAQTAEA